MPINQEGFIMTNIILCGGSGTRLWPLSRTLMPKQFVKLFEEKPSQTLKSVALLKENIKTGCVTRKEEII